MRGERAQGQVRGFELLRPATKDELWEALSLSLALLLASATSLPLTCSPVQAALTHSHTSEDEESFSDLNEPSRAGSKQELASQMPRFFSSLPFTSLYFSWRRLTSTQLTPLKLLQLLKLCNSPTTGKRTLAQHLLLSLHLSVRSSSCFIASHRSSSLLLRSREKLLLLKRARRERTCCKLGRQRKPFVWLLYLRQVPDLEKSLKSFSPEFNEQASSFTSANVFTF